jgi:hypothetical protein
VNPLKHPAAWALVVALLLALALASCDFDDSPAQPPGVEVDIDAPKVKKPKTSAPKAPSYRKPSTTRRR